MLPLLMCLSLIAADPPPNAGPIRLPVIAANADPKPMPGPDAAVTFAPGQRYVFDSPVKCHVRAYPPGALTWVELKGPRDITAKFVGGTGDEEDRTFAGPFVYRVTAKHAGCVELVMTPYGFTKDEEIRSIKLDVLGGCKADPTPPTPGPGPTPTPTPGPTTPTKMTVVVVEETADAVATRGALFSDPALNARMKAKGHGFRVVDKDVVGPDGKPPADVKRFLDRASGKALPQLFLVDEQGKARFAGDMTKTAAELLELMEKFGG